MKKLLLSAVTALLGWIGASADVVAGQAYHIKHNATGAYFNMEKTGYGDNQGRLCASLQPFADASVIYLVQNPANSSQFQIRVNSVDGYNLSNTGNESTKWCSVINSNDGYYWTLTENPDVENGVWFTRTGAAVNTANLLGPNLNNGSGQPIYTNQDGSNANKKAWCLWVLEPISADDYDVTLSIDLGNSHSVTYTLGQVTKGDTYTAPTVYDDVLTITGAPTGAVSGEVHLQGTLKAGVIPFKLNHAIYPTRWVITGSNGMASTGDNFSYADGSWYLEIPQADGTFKIFDLEYAKYFASAAAAANTPIPFADSAANAAKFTLTRDASGAEAIGTGSVYLSAQHSPESGYVTSYKATTDVSSYYFMVYDETQFAANKEYYSNSTTTLTELPNGSFKVAYTAAQQIYNDLKDNETLATQVAAVKAALDQADAARFGRDNISTIVTALTTANAPFDKYPEIAVLFNNGDAFADLGIAPESAVTAWQNAKNITVFNDQAKTDVTTAYTALVASSNATPGGAHIKLSPNAGPAQYLTFGNNIDDDTNGLSAYRTTDANSSGKQVWTIKAAIGGFYLFNEYYNKYLKFSTKSEATNVEGDTRMRPTDEAGASLFVFELQNATAGRVGVKYVGTDITVDSSRNYLHANNDTRVVRWAAGDNSSWYLRAADEDAAASEHLNGAVDLAAAPEFDESKVGTALGYFTPSTGMKYTDAKTAAQAAQADGTAPATRRTAAANLWNASANTYALNIPEEGRYYRIQNVASSKYMLNTPNDDQRLTMDVSNNATAVTTIWVFDGTRLVAYPSGLVLGKFARNDQSNSWGVCNEGTDADHCGSVTFSAGETLGSFIISADTDRHLNGAEALVNCDDESSNSNSWKFEAVNWLPIAPSQSNGGQLYTPFVFTEAIQDDYNGARYGFYTVELDGDKVYYTPLGVKVLPAGTPVILKEGSNPAPDATNKHIYLQVNHALPASVEVTANGDLQGTVKAFAQEEGKTYFFEGNGHELAASTASTVRGFRSYIVVDNEEVSALEITLPEHSSEIDEPEFAIGTDNNHTLTLTHSENLKANPAKSHLWISIKKVEPKKVVAMFGDEEGGEAENSNEIKIYHNAMTFNGTTATAPLGSKLEAAEYTVNVPAGFFLVGDENVSKALNYGMTVNADGTTTGINEVMTGISEGSIYDLQGRKLAAPVKGINIIGGRKVLVK